MLFRPNLFYRHEAMTCCAIEALKAFYIGEKDMWSLRIRWWRLKRSGELQPMFIEERVKINSTGWERVNEPS